MRTRAQIAVCGLLALLLLLSASMAQAQRAGDVIVCFELAKRAGNETLDADIFAQRLSPDGTLVWGDGKPVAVCASSHLAGDPVACEDGEGGAIVAFTFEWLEGEHRGDVDIAAQRLDEDGTPLWNGGRAPQPVATSRGREDRPVIISDGRSGAIIVYQWTNAAGDTDVLAQRIAADGSLAWNDGELPVPVADSTGVECAPVAVPDGRGGVIVFFERQAANGDVDTMAQRLSADGKPLWNGGEPVAVADTESAERRVAAIPDGRGGAIAVFELAFLQGEHEGDVDIMAQRISGDGALLWGDSASPALVSSAVAIERSATLASDGAGGVIVAFEYEPRTGEFAGDIDILAQRVDADGEALWNNAEKSSVVSSSPGLERYPVAVPSGDGGAVVVFEHEFRGGDNDGDVDVFAQRLSPAGEMVWNAGEKSVMVLGSKWLERSPVAFPDGEGGVIVVCASQGPAGEHEGDVDADAQRLNRDGEMLWNGGQRPVEVANSGELELNACGVLIGGR